MVNTRGQYPITLKFSFVPLTVIYFQFNIYGEVNNMPIENRDRVIQIVMPLEEAELIRQQAKEAKMPISKYMRQRLEKLDRLETLIEGKSNGKST